MRPLHLISALLLAGGVAHADEGIAPGPPGQDTETCARLVALDEAGRVGALTAIEPFGDDIGAEDEAAARDWADQVARRCAGHPDRPLPEAANLALGAED